MTKKDLNENSVSVSKDNQAFEQRRLAVIGSDMVHMK